eukprot:TRINITY_DN9839_c0_g1_i8.p1 TRINITY_DN9839_c0_g1~~TRINITY_DN9839_c0_g1_i8.p1  ORF type:complete len:598 (+),score=56.53 TRINITY_DN9839_c0_g1_i8:67-1860(+)
MLPPQPSKSNVGVDTTLLANVATNLRLLGGLLEDMCRADVGGIPERSIPEFMSLARSRKDECASSGHGSVLSQAFSSRNKVANGQTQFDASPTLTNLSNMRGLALHSEALPPRPQHALQVRVISNGCEQCAREPVACPCFTDGNHELQAVPPGSPCIRPISDDVASDTLERDSGDKDEFSRVSSRIARYNSAAWVLQEEKSTCKHKTLFDVIGEWSDVGKLVIFLGGYSTTSRSTIYNSIVTCSFGTCFLVCAISRAFSPMHPFRNDMIGILTVYIHVIGFHTWRFWRTHGEHEYLRDLAWWLVKTDTERQARRREAVTAMLASLLLALVIIVTAICLLGHCGPSIHIWLSMEETPTTRVLALAHAVVMFAAIPQHVPAIVVGLMSFVFICALHHSDFTSITRRVEALLPSRVAEGEVLMLNELTRTEGKDARLVMESVCSEAEKAQLRLEWTCSECSLLWCHQVVYAFLQVIVVVEQIRPILNAETREESVKYWRDHSDFSVTLLLFHGLCGVFVLLAALLAPAAATSSFRNHCRHLVEFIRCSEASIDMCAYAGCFLEKRVRGFVVWKRSVTTSLVSQFYSVVVICTILRTAGVS